MSVFGQQISLQSRKPEGFTPRQTQGAYNMQQAQAQAAADPRMNMKGFDKAGLSRGKGQQGYAAATAANAYAQQKSAAESIGLEDAVANADLNLTYSASRDQQALALARLQEQMRNQQAMYQLQQQANALGFAGGLYNNTIGSLGGGGGLLSGLM